MTEIGNRKERLRVREAGASAAGRGQRPYASFPDRQPHRNPIAKHKSGSQAAQRYLTLNKSVLTHADNNSRVEL